MNIENWQLKYIENRPSEVMGQRPMSPQFFQTLSEQGPFAAIQQVKDDIKKHGHDHAGLDAAALIFGSAVLAAGVTTTFNNLLEQKNDGNFSLLDQARLLFYSGLYAGAVGLIMAGHTDAREEVEVRTEGQRKITTTTTKSRWGATHEHTEIEVDEPRSYFDPD